MSKLGTILGIISIGKAFTGTPVYKRLLSGVAVVICMTIVTGMLAGALLLTIFYGVYQAFLTYGLESTPAMVATAALALMTLVVLAISTINYLRDLMNVPHIVSEFQSPLLSKATGIAQAFMEGLNGTPAPVVPRQRWL